jgi:Zn-dependent metalloprotease
MKKNLLLLLAGCFVFMQFSFAGMVGDMHQKTFIKNKKEVPDFAKQQQLRSSAAWLAFSTKHNDWKPIFDERNGMPHRAYGKGIQLTGSGDVASKSLDFIKTEMSSFNIKTEDLVLRNSKKSKYNYVDFYQTYLGLEVMNSRVTVRSTLDEKVILFGADVYNDIQLNTNPQLSDDVISNYAIGGIEYVITGISVDPKLKVLPVPVDGKYEYHLVYTVIVSANDFENFPARYNTLVDANSGEVLYRQDEIDHSADVSLRSTVSVNPTVPTITVSIPFARVKVSGTDYFTDKDGNVTISSVNSPTSATVYVQGTWCKVLKGSSNTVKSFTTTINTGSNSLTYDGSGVSLQEVSAFYDVSTIHEFMKGYMPDFTGLDIEMKTTVDVAGSCNAYYDGTLNFYAPGGGCSNMAFINDVVFHEYGHGINDHYYSDNGFSFNNGAMGEGYADVWAMGIIEQPVIGAGFYDGITDGIREYQNSIKVYPQDLVGEVHADGEIIAGAWWWTNNNIGSMDTTMQIFTESYNGFANGSNGNEGTVYRDILLDALTADDNNGNINDGTPHDAEILTAFAMHGITLIGDAVIKHTEPVSANTIDPINIQATITLDYPIYFGSATLHYKIENAPDYLTAPMTLVNGNTYQGSIPAQAPATLIYYYFTVEDIYGNEAAVQPPGVVNDLMDNNIPYVLLNGYNKMQSEDFDNFAGFWITGDPFDDATTGKWTIDEPQATYQIPGDDNSLVQTGTDHTTEGVNTNVCAITANDASPNDPYNTQDVDNGATTLYSPTFDLSGYDNPAISYFRWYTNEASANPRNDHWKSFITNDNTNWIAVERNNHPQRAWRNFAFHVSDYVTPNATVKMKFIAEDSTILGAYLDGGSIIEAGLDDLYLWSEAKNVGINEISDASISVFPNPATDIIGVEMIISTKENISVELINAIGQSVYQKTVSGLTSKVIFAVKDFESGLYTVKISADGILKTKKIAIVH